MARTIQITIDCSDPRRLSEFWAQALGYIPDPPPPGFPTWEAALAARGVPESEWNSASAVSDPDGSGPRIFFQRVPESKRVKNRLHMDVRVGGPLERPAEERRRAIRAEAERLAAAGAAFLEEHAGQWGEHWIVMLDPEGNEFCVT